MLNALSIDLEYWYSAELVRKFAAESAEKRLDLIAEMTRPILDLLDGFGVSATFFVLGVVAEEHPEVVEEIYESGHEIGSHAYSHKTLYELGRERFEEEIKLSVELLRGITKEKPVGFRAPSFSVDNSTRWAFEVLERYGFKYDSSVFPIRTRLYGVPNAPVQIYKPLKEEITKEDPERDEGGIIEFPLTVVKLVGRNIPVSGGFFLRVLPLKILKSALKRVNAKERRPAVIYLHPWEVYAETPRLNLPLSSRFITYYGIGSAKKKLEGLLRCFKFAPMKEVLRL